MEVDGWSSRVRAGQRPETEQGTAQTSRRGPRARLHRPEPLHHAEFLRRFTPPPMSAPRARTWYQSRCWNSTYVVTNGVILRLLTFSSPVFVTCTAARGRLRSCLR